MSKAPNCTCLKRSLHLLRFATDSCISKAICALKKTELNDDQTLQQNILKNPFKTHDAGIGNSWWLLYTITVLEVIKK